jgi:hypothetical protein
MLQRRIHRRSDEQQTCHHDACSATQVSYACDTEGQYDEFVYYWISAINRATPGGAQVNADSNNDGIITSREAFTYAQSNDNRSETPQKNDPSNIGERTLL